MRLRKRSVRLYVYHNRYQELSGKKQLSLFGALFNICYFTGLSLIYTLLSPFLAAQFSARQLRRDAQRTARDLARKAKNLRVTGWRTSMAIFLLLVLVGLGTFHSFILAAQGEQVKARVLGDADLGISSLTAGGLSINGDDPDLTQKHFQEALQNFDKIQADLETNGVVLDGILKVIPQRDDADKLTESAKLATEAASHLANLYQETKRMKLTASGLSGAGDNGQNIQTVIAEFQSANEEITSATDLLKGVDPSLIPSDKRDIFTQVQGQLSDIQGTLSVASELADILGDILVGQKNILVMFENDNELRPTGGFLGTFGAMTINNGAIASLHISSIYDLDGQLHEIINPPQPVYAVNDRWFLRDSNWFADFPTTAQKISEFYQKEGGAKPDEVWALTPTIVTDLLNITGPITLPKYGVTLDSSNFIEKTQVETSVDYDKTLNKPKQFLADFFPLFLQKLSNLNNQQLVSVLGAFQKDLQTKEILLYAQNPDLENKLKSFHWTGEIANTDRDYLSIVSANLGGTKTDLKIQQTASLTTHIDSDGSITDTLTLDRSNPFPKQDAFINKSFVRILVPQGSTLVSANGFSPSPVPSTLPSVGGIDPDVAAWEQGMIQDVSSGTLSGTETGKTFFGNWVILNGGDEKKVSITYKLPFKINDMDHYSLLFQKQPGVPDYPVGYQVYYPGRARQWYNKDPNGGDDQSTVFNFTTSGDQFFGLMLSKN